VRYSEQPQRLLRGRWSAERVISGAARSAVWGRACLPKDRRASWS